MHGLGGLLQVVDIERDVALERDRDSLVADGLSVITSESEHPHTSEASSSKLKSAVGSSGG